MKTTNDIQQLITETEQRLKNEIQTLSDNQFNSLKKKNRVL